MEQIETNEWEHVATGGFGKIYRKKNTDIALKVPKRESYKCKAEGEILHTLQSTPYFPRLFSYSDHSICFEFVQGVPLHEWLSEGNQMTDEMLKQVYDAYKHSLMCGVRPIELEPDHIIWNDPRIRIVDVGMYKKIAPIQDPLVLSCELNDFSHHFMKWVQFWCKGSID